MAGYELNIYLLHFMHVSVNVHEQKNAREVNTATVSKATVPLDE